MDFWFGNTLELAYKDETGGCGKAPSFYLSNEEELCVAVVGRRPRLCIQWLCGQLSLRSLRICGMISDFHVSAHFSVGLNSSWASMISGLRLYYDSHRWIKVWFASGTSILVSYSWYNDICSHSFGYRFYLFCFVYFFWYWYFLQVYSCNFWRCISPFIVIECNVLVSFWFTTSFNIQSFVCCKQTDSPMKAIYNERWDCINSQHLLLFLGCVFDLCLLWVMYTIHWYQFTYSGLRKGAVYNIEGVCGYRHVLFLAFSSVFKMFLTLP